MTLEKVIRGFVVVIMLLYFIIVVWWLRLDKFNAYISIPIVSIAVCSYVYTWYLRYFNYFTLQYLRKFDRDLLLEFKYDSGLDILYGRIRGKRFWIPVEHFVYSNLNNEEKVSYTKNDLSVGDFIDRQENILNSSFSLNSRLHEKKSNRNGFIFTMVLLLITMLLLIVLNI